MSTQIPKQKLEIRTHGILEYTIFAKDEYQRTDTHERKAEALEVLGTLHKPEQKYAVVVSSSVRVASGLNIPFYTTYIYRSEAYMRQAFASLVLKVGQQLTAKKRFSPKPVLPSQTTLGKSPGRTKILLARRKLHWNKPWFLAREDEVVEGDFCRPTYILVHG